MERKDWSKEEILHLIEMYRENEFLWNRNHESYRKNRHRKSEVFTEFGHVFNCSALEVQRKLHNLRNQVSQEMGKIKKKNSGDVTDDMYFSNWKFFQHLTFLIPTIEAKSSQINRVSCPPTENRLSDSLNGFVNGDDRLTKRCVNDRKSLQSGNIIVTPTKKWKSSSYDDESESLNGTRDDNDRFGEYVALELRSLRSEENRRRLKSEIRKAIVRITDEDDFECPSTTACTTTALLALGNPFGHQHDQQANHLTADHEPVLPPQPTLTDVKMSRESPH